MVFSNRKFIVVANNSDSYEKHTALTSLITAHNGEIVPWNVRADGDVSPKLVIVSSGMDYERAEEMKRFMIPTVTPEWVHACTTAKKLVPMRPYSPDPRNFMRDVIVCFSQLSSGDSDVFRAGIIASGGDVSEIVTRYTSHVVATSLDTPECQLVIHSRENNPEVGIKIVKPEWIDACMSLGIKVEDRPFWLDKPALDNLGTEVEEQDNLEHSTTTQHNLTGTFLLQDSPRLAVQQSMRESLGSNILEGRHVFFGNDLDLSERVDKTVQYLVETNGGKITRDLSDAQIYLGKWREGDQYIEASKRRIIVGNITWLYWVTIHQRFEKPTHLLHYPEVRGGLAPMQGLRICITNYTGDARAYLQSLITAIGASYSGKLIEKNTTHLIAAYQSGQKYEAAKKWGIPVVNHLWIEDCYAHWQMKDPELRLYTYFPPKLSMSTLVGARNLVASVLHKFQRPDDFTASREHHKRQAKQKAGDWLHDAMIVENEFHENLRRGKILPIENDNDLSRREKSSSQKRSAGSSNESSKSRRVSDSVAPRSNSASPVPQVLSTHPSRAASPLENDTVSFSNSKNSDITAGDVTSGSTTAVNGTAINASNTSANDTNTSEGLQPSQLVNETNKTETSPHKHASTPPPITGPMATQFTTANSSKTSSRAASPLTSQTPVHDKTTPRGGSQASRSKKFDPARRVMVSGMDDPPTAKAVAKIGLSLVKTTPVHIMVAPRFLKTSKFLQALADTEEFVSPAWLERSLEAGVLLPTDKYHLDDEQLVSAMQSRAELNNQGLFGGISLRLDTALKDKAATFRELVKSHRGRCVLKNGPGVITVGEQVGQLPWSTFIDCIQHMDRSFLDRLVVV